MDISTIRKEYKFKSLEEQEVDSNPFNQFLLWFEEAIKAEVVEVNAMVLGTVGQGDKPSSRVVLLKNLDEKGFVFYTNYRSRKGEEILANPFASLTFFWPQLERQVRIEGVVEKVSEEESIAYFNSRPWESRVGAWVSMQSSKIANREELEQRFKTLSEEFSVKGEIPKPAYWGGFRVIPLFLEFWQGRPSRLHDRICYEKEGDKWEIYRLAP